MLNFTVGSEIVKRKYISASSSIINGFMFYRERNYSINVSTFYRS
ncbi:hypothetical protein [Wolbachia endosymbiont of Brugia malayi]|nr:hypothetical protein [Wolbachia endosymbiont of Brugia malayi]